MREMVDRKQRKVDSLQQRANALNTEIVDCSAKLSDLKEQIIETVKFTEIAPKVNKQPFHPKEDAKHLACNF